MRRNLIHLLLILALAFQGMVAVAGDMLPGTGVQQHCANHDKGHGDCPCCPEGTLGAACTVQCSVAQAAVSMAMPVRISVPDMPGTFTEPPVSDLSYVPLTPPPIA